MPERDLRESENDSFEMREAAREKRRRENRDKRKKAVAHAIALLLALAAAACIAVSAIYIHFDKKGDAEAGRQASAAVSAASEAAENEPAEETPAPTPSPTVTPTPTSTPTPTPTPEPDPAKFNEDDAWCCFLISVESPLPEDWAPNIVSIGDDHYVDARAYDALMQMLADCEAAGNVPMVCSSYRTWDTQEYLFTNMYYRYLNMGNSEEEADRIAATIVQRPGSSEHQSGLALDIVSAYNQNLDESQADEPTQIWLMENSWKYGFNLRYPPEKSDITGIIYEPWHYRYVGLTAAEVMYREHLCLEEYLEYYAPDELKPSKQTGASETTGTDDEETAGTEG